MRELAWHDAAVDDRALVAAVLDGDASQFSAFVERETGPVYRACLRILGNAADAEDLTQETFMTAYRFLGTYRREGSLRAWVLRIAARLSYRKLARRRGEGRPEELAERHVADPEADPLRATLRDERGRQLREAVRRLPDRYREVVALRFFAELSLAEIADVTGRPLNTVKTHLRRGLEQLRPSAEREVVA